MSLRLHGSSNLSAHGGKRIESRARVAIEASLETVLGRSRGYLLNLSCHGAMVQMPDPPQRRADVVLRCGPLDVLGIVAWVQQERIGIEFDEPIPEGQVIELRRLADEAVRHLAHQRLGRPALTTRALTSEEWKMAQEWSSSSAFR